MSVALYRVDELRAIERAAQAHLAPGTLMARAGKAAADWIAARHAAQQRSAFCVVCGPGNNGGDGFMAAAELAQRGHAVVCVLLGAQQPTADDAAAAHTRWISQGGSVLDRLPADGRFDSAIDAMFGIGLARPLVGEFAQAAHWFNAQRNVLALDVPSGLNADTGAWVGDIPGVHAAATLTFIGDKPGLHTASGVDASGAIEVARIGVDALPRGRGMLIDPSDLAPLLRPRRRDTHKGTYGSVLVVGGGHGMVGAAFLAARAALRLGAGRVYVDAIGAPDLRVDPMQPELMFRALGDLHDLQSIVIGCGLGLDGEAHARMSAALEHHCPVVADADALNLLEADAALRDQLCRRPAPTVLTPHPLEAARLLESNAGDVQRDRIGAAQRLARECNAVVVLKGVGSVIARPDGRYGINPTGSPALATAGTGDVLAGMLGAFLAQGFGAWDAAVAAAWLHGRAAEGADIGLVAGDVAPRAAALLQRLRAGATG
jgi:hydroxyethylthiazole kinase-like uncharacterized protein yjeF